VIATTPLLGSAPASLAIDGVEAKSGDQDDAVDIAVGFSDGSFAIHTLVKKARRFLHRYTHAPSSNGTISAIAFASPYILTMTLEPMLSLYSFDNVPNPSTTTEVGPPILRASLRSYTAYPPLSLAIRVSTSIVASIAYAMPTWMSRWSVGLQELRLTLDGAIIESRVASSPADYRRTPATRRLALSSPSSEPTSLSYAHPYLLTAHPDNTLTLYMVNSSVDELTIGPGNRLWGHTSSISTAQVGDRGKAVSVSTKGNELRVWELEGGTVSQTQRKRDSVQVRPDDHTMELVRIAPTLSSRHEDLTTTLGWIAFDEEKVVTLREKMHGAQALVVYDFT